MNPMPVMHIRRIIPWNILPALCAVVFLIMVPAMALDLSLNAHQSSVPAISKGDTVTVHGIATGQPANGLRIWLVGNNYATISSASVNSDDTYSYELKPAETQALASGQYFVLVQHPMMNGEFDVRYNAGTGEVVRLADSKVLFKLTGAGRLQASDAAYALVHDIGSQNIDDSFSEVSFIVSPSATSIDPIGNHIVGDSFVITGSTNLAIGDALAVEVISSSFRPTTKQQSGEFSGASGTVYVGKGSGLNRWSFPVDSAGWKPDEYIVTVSAIVQEATASTTFVLEEYPEKTGTTGAVTTPLTVETTPVTTQATQVTPPATTQSAPAGIVTVLAACGGIILIVRGSRGKL